MRFNRIDVERDFQEFMQKHSLDVMKLDSEKLIRTVWFRAYKKGYSDATSGLIDEAKDFDPYSFAKELAEELDYIGERIGEVLEEQ